MNNPESIKERQPIFDSMFDYYYMNNYVSVADIGFLADNIVKDIRVWIKFDNNSFGPFKEIEK